MQTLTTAFKKGQAITKKAGIYYASYEATKKTAKKYVDQYAHVWKVDNDYTSTHFDSVVDRIFAENRVPLGERTSQSINYDGDPTIYFKDWVLLRIPGVAIIQGKRNGGMAEFRSPRKRDIERLQTYIDEQAELLSAQEPVIVYNPVDIPQWTNIRAWDQANERWVNAGNRRARSFDSVILPAATQAAIENDLKRFVESQERLSRLEMPWRRGYLLTGPPGTGKTSAALAIAARLGFNIARLPLSDIKSDTELTKAISQLGGETVLVIEDIDAFAVSHERDHNPAKDGDLSLSGLLNALDGFETPQGLVTIVTTNHVEHLDDALVRAGRLDRRFELGHVQPAELERLHRWFYDGADLPSPAPANTADAGLSPALVAETFKQHLDDAEAGWTAVLELVPAPWLAGVDRRLGLAVA